MQPIRRSRSEALFGALGFSITVLVTMLAYFYIFTSFDSGYVKGTLAVIITLVLASGLAGALRAVGLRISPVSATVVLATTFAAFFSVWLMTIGHGAVECWSCVKVNEYEFRLTNGESAIWYLILFAISTACAAITISTGVLLFGRVLDRRRV